MKTSKNFAPSVLPISFRKSDEPLQSGHSFFMEEIWKSIPGYSRYLASNKGRIKRLYRWIVDSKGNEYALPEKMLKQFNNGNGYKLVGTVSDLGKTQGAQVHRLVALAFLENPNNYPQVNHIDSDRANNVLENLEWVSVRENSVHGQRRFKKTSKYPGVFHRPERYGKKWSYSVMHNKKIRYGKYFHTEDEAYNAYKEFCRENNIQNKYA